MLVLAISVLAACDLNRAQDQFDHQREFCILAENNGLLEAAYEGCQSALMIAKAEGYESHIIADLLYRLGRIERQRSNFVRAEQLIQQSLAIAEQSGEIADIGLGLIQLSLTLAGQARWAEGVQVLERASPLVFELTGRDRTVAAGAFNLYAARMANLNENTEADRFEDIARELAQDAKSDAR